MKKKYLILTVVSLFVLSGCTPGPGNIVGPDTPGVWESIIKLSSITIIFFSELFGDNLVFGIMALGLTFSLILLPFTISQQKSSANMAKIQPDVSKINKKYEKYAKDDKDAQMRKQQELMAIYKKHGINPLASCLPLFIQFPLLIGVYGGVTNLILYTHNGQPATLTPEQIAEGIEPGLTGLHAFGQQLLSLDLFGLDMGLIGATPQLIWLPILSALISFVSMKISNIGVDMSGNQMMKYMMWIGPVMSLIIGLQLPGVITIYWITTNIVRTIITIFFKRNKIKEIMDKKKISQ